MASPEGRQALAKATELIEQAGAQLVRKEKTGSGHVKLVFRYGGREEFYIMPMTPSCHRTVKNCEADIRRQLKALTGHKPGKEQPKPPKNKTHGGQVEKIAAPTPPKPKQKLDTRSLARLYGPAKTVYAIHAQTGESVDRIKQAIRKYNPGAVRQLNAEENELRVLATRKPRARQFLRKPDQRGLFAKWAFRMYFVENRSQPEVAEELGVSIPTAMNLAQEGNY